MANELELNSHNLDRTESPNTEDITSSVVGEPRLNVDSFKESGVAEPIALTKTYTPENVDFDGFRKQLVKEVMSSASPRSQALVDHFAAIGDITKDEWLDSETVEWMVSALTATEITDPFKTLPAMVRSGFFADNMSAEYEVLNTSTAQNIVEYTIEPGNGAGTLDFEDGTLPIKTLDFSALTQIFAKPDRYVYVKLKNIIGSGNTWPKIIVKEIYNNNGAYIRLFGRYIGSGGGVPLAVGTSLEDQALKIAEAWNNGGTSSSMTNVSNGSGFTCHVQAVAVGNVVEFVITDEDTNSNFTSITRGEFYNPGGMNGVSLVGNIHSDGNYINLGRDTRKKTWSLSPGVNDTLTVTILGHGPRPGTTSLLSYDVKSKRNTKRGQVPQSTVSGLKEQLDNLSQRLKNKGF